MHIVLGILGTIVTILVLLNRLADAGIDLGGLNPFLWHRRRKWRKLYEGNPLYRIESPMDATAILMVAAAKADGDISREDKHLLLSLFESDFKLSKKDAAGLLISSAHLLGDGVELRDNVEKFLAVSRTKFSDDQARSAISLVARAAGEVTARHDNAKALMAEVERLLAPKSTAEPSTWS